MAEEWDLSAIVRSCQSATTTATTEIPLITTTATTTTNTIIPLLSPQNTTSASLATCTSSSTVKEEYDPFSSFPNLLQPITNEFQELDQLLAPFNPTTTNTTTNTTTSGVGINSNSPDLERQQLQHLLPLIAPLTDDDPSIWPHLVPEASTSGISRFHNDQHQSQQQNQLLQLVHKQDQSQASQSSTSSIALPDTLLQPQTPTRSRKIRKNQQKRMVCHVTADNLSADMWAWRKYGQKPIKGSPYPRNYYRCSSSKGCCARKQVERSNEEANMFIITYTGDHNHPRPTHRNSLAGSTRSKPSTPANQNQSAAAAVVVAPPPPPPPLPHSPEQENEEEMEPESPDPETETEVDFPEGDSTDWTGFNPG